MKCTRAEKFLPLYVAGDLAGRRTARRVASHLATCERCRAVAEEYDASRNLVCAVATLPPDFDGAFYEELRRSVLAEIKRERPRLAPPAPAGFASLFNTARFAYAASLVLIIAAVAALSLYSYLGRKSEDAARPQNVIADVNRERTGTPSATATPLSTQAPTGGARQTVRQRRVDLLKHTPAHAKRNPPAPEIVAAPGEHAAEIARNSSGNSGGETTVAPEVSRIEIQTSDPNIRIIWLSPKPDAVAQPLK